MEYAVVNKRSWERDSRSIKILSGRFAGMKLIAITFLLVEKYKGHRRESVGPATVNRELAYLKHMFTKAM